MNSNAKIDLDSLRVIEAVAEQGSFSGAGIVLHRVTSTISYTVAKLEKSFGVKFFERQKNGVVLTEAGRELLRHSQNLLQVASDAQRAIERVANGWEADLTIAVSDLINQNALIPLLDGLLAQSPQMNITISMEVLNGLWDSLATNRADILIGTSVDIPDTVGSVSTCELGDYEFVFAIAADHPLAKQHEPVAYDEIKKHRVIAVADTSRNMPNLSFGLLPGQPVLTVANHQLKVEAQRKGLGVGTVSRKLVEPHIASGEMVIKEVELDTNGFYPAVCAWRTTHKGQGLQWLIKQLQKDEIKQQLLDVK